MKFREYMPEQNWLIPPNIEDEIPEDDMVRALNTVIDELDISSFEISYKDVGNIAYHPRLMLKVILYSYQQGIFSSRKMERAARRNIYYWYLTGKQTPNFRTLCKLIKRHQNAIEDVFSQVLWVCQREGLIDLETVAVDGSIIRANASKDALWDSKRVQSELTALKEKASDCLARHIESDRVEEELEKELKTPASSHQKSNSKDTFKGLLKQIQDVKKVELELTESGKKRVNTTDNDAYLNGKHGKPKEMSYNANIVVEKSHQIIVSADVDNRPGEHHLVPTHLNVLSQYFTQRPTYFLGDSAYANQETAYILNQYRIQSVCPQFQIQHYRRDMKPNRNTTGRFSSYHFKPICNGNFMICPADHILKRGALQHRKGRKVPFFEYSNPSACRTCMLKQWCTSGHNRVVKRGVYADMLDDVESFLHTHEGYTKYKERIGIVEPVFGNIKWNKGFRFTFRGLSLAKTQFKLACIMHNLEKLAKSRGCNSFLWRFYNVIAYLRHLEGRLRTFFRQLFLIHSHFCHAALHFTAA